MEISALGGCHERNPRGRWMQWYTWSDPHVLGIDLEAARTCRNPQWTHQLPCHGGNQDQPSSQAQTERDHESRQVSQKVGWSLKTWFPRRGTTNKMYHRHYGDQRQRWETICFCYFWLLRFQRDWSGDGYQHESTVMYADTGKCSESVFGVTGEASIPARFTRMRSGSMTYSKVWTAQEADATIMPADELRTIIWRYFIGYWNNRRICSANGELPPMVKR